MARKKLNYRFHNPNTVETTADYILKVFIEVNEKKVEQAMRETTENVLEEKIMEKNERFGTRSPLVLSEKTR